MANLDRSQTPSGAKAGRIDLFRGLGPDGNKSTTIEKER